MRALTTEEKAKIRKVKDAVNRSRSAKRKELTQQIRRASYQERADLKAQRESLVPITGDPVHVQLGTEILPPIDYERFRKTVRSVRGLMIQRIFIDGQQLVLEYRGPGMDGRAEFIQPSEYTELNGLLPVVEL